MSHSDENDYWSIVLRQLRKSRMGLSGLTLICFMYLMAVFAPFLAESIPLMVAHTNESDEECRTCVALDEYWDVLKLRDGTTLEGRLVVELPEGILFQTGTIPERYSTNQVEFLDKESTPQVLKLKDSQIARNGKFLGEVPAEVHFSVRGEAKAREIRAEHKASLERLPRRHGKIRYWPLIRGLDRVDWILLLSLFVLAAGLPLFRSFRSRGRTRNAAMKTALLFLALPLAAAGLFIGLRKNERQRFNRVDYRALEGRLENGQMFWPAIRFSASTEDKTALPNQRPMWIAWKPEDLELAQKWYGPEWRERARLHHLGTDGHQRDVLAMIVHGTRISLSVGFVAVGIYVTIGIIVGSVAGFFGGWIDDVVMRVIEIVICFPTFFLIITIIAIAPPSIFWVMAAIALVQWTTVARLVRAEFLRLRKNDFVTSARALGASRPRIIFRHILPNALSPVLVSATFGVAGAILTESALSFLGLGVPPDVATWGSILRQGQKGLPGTWWLALIPGVAIFATVTSYNLFGESLRDALDPRLKGTS